MFDILLRLIFNLPVLLTIAGILVLALVTGYAIGFPRVLKFFADIRVWFAIGAVLAFMAFAHAERRAEALEAKIESMRLQDDADTDAADSMDRRQEQRERRSREADYIRDQTAEAPSGEKLDATLDAIAEVIASKGIPHEEAQNPPAAQPDSVGDGLRPKDDVIVVP